MNSFLVMILFDLQRVLQEILGHASYSTTADIYVHILGQVKLSQMNRLEDYLTDINMN